MEDLYNKFQQRIDEIEKAMTASFGMDYHVSPPNGFTYGDIYEKAGKDDRVVTLSFKEGTESFKKWPTGLTCTFQYYQKERKAMEENRYALDNKLFVKAQNLLSDEKHICDVSLKDIATMIIAPVLEKGNKFYSNELRTPKVINVPFEADGGGHDIIWMYKALKLYLAKGIALTPDEHAEYLAYKIVLEKDQLTNEEQKEIFDENGSISNIDVAHHYLMWKKEAGIASDKDLENLTIVNKEIFTKRLYLLNKELQKMGLSIFKLKNEHPDKLLILLTRCLSFRERRFNVVGKHLLYLDFKGFLHIYLRHVEELKVEKQFAERDKFQLKEKDVFTVINIMMHQLNDEYQIWKDNHPNSQYHWYGPRAYYNGDYYEAYINPDGSISTFYKGTQSK